MERQLAKEDTSDAVPDSIPPPDILGDFSVWNEAHWDYWAIRKQPELWLTKLQLANAESSRIQAEMYDDRYRVNEKAKRQEQEPLNEAEVAEIRASNPRFEQLPDDALRKLWRRRSS